MTLARLSGLACAAFLLAGTVTAAEWRGWTAHGEEYPTAVALERFANDVTATTVGRITATVFRSGVLGAEADAINEARVGRLAFGAFGMEAVGDVVPRTRVLSLPYLFTGEAHLRRTLEGEVGAVFVAAMEAERLVALAWYDSGTRNVYTRRVPVTGPGDLAGLRLAVPPNPVLADLIETLGGEAVQLKHGEIFGALASGAVDGAENSFVAYDTLNHRGMAEHYALTAHLIVPECLCIAKAIWDGLTPEDQEIVRAAAVRSGELQRALWAERSEASRRAAEAAGARVLEDVDRDALRAAAAPVRRRFLEANPYLRGMVDRIGTLQ